MPLSIFGHDPKTHFQDRIGGSGSYRHSFGGTPEQFGLQFENLPVQPHLIYRLDLSDPAIQIEIPEIEFLPLLYGYYDDDECSYLVQPNNVIRLLKPIAESRYPPWEAPSSFPYSPTTLDQQAYDPTNADDVMRLKGVFDWDELSPSERTRALKLARELSSLTEDDGIDENWTYETVIECMYEPPFVQGTPVETCKNPDCKNFRSEDDESSDYVWMKTLAIQNEPSESELIWPDEYVRTIWMFCPNCNSITALNRY